MERDSGLAFDDRRRRWALVEIRSGPIGFISVRNAIVGIDFVEVFQQDSSNLEDRLADHVNGGMIAR